MPQVYAVLTADNLDGMSLAMFVLFLLIQVAYLFEGVRSRNKGMFVATALTVPQTLLIIAVLIART